jgi:hypothetical protein
MENPEGRIVHPFPQTRPDVEIAESEEPIGGVDCVELRWWFGIPRPGDRTMRASYDAEALELVRVTDMEAAGTATVHGVDCVEVRVREWSAESGRKINGLVFYARVEEAEESRWVAVAPEKGGKGELFTFLDEGFEYQWGASANPVRRLYDDGRYRPRPDGSYETTNGAGLGAGTYDVTIGGKTFRCLRVLEPDLSEPGGGELTEAYVERGGRTVFHRRYDGRFYRGGDLLQQYPENPRITIDGNVYVQCDCTGRAHDDITDTSLGETWDTALSWRAIGPGVWRGTSGR